MGERWTTWKDKKIFLQLKTGRKYTGIVTDIVDTGDGLIFLEIIDKFGKRVMFTTGELVSIEEER